MGLVIKKTDAQIQREVLEELKWDTRVKETDVGVEVDGGIVTLTGTVDSWPARIAAQQAAHRVAGVLDVANDIHVNLPGYYERNDTDVARAVRQALEWDVLVPNDRIRTTVSSGVVTLEGTVESYGQCDDAVRCVSNLAGVREVKNLLVIEPPAPSVSPGLLRQTIEDALERHAQHASKHVRIAIADGKVTLSGEVPSWPERNAVEGAVRATRGVCKVDNQLRIQPS
jgi:osmotically-inducible protein OsmY